MCVCVCVWTFSLCYSMKCRSLLAGVEPLLFGGVLVVFVLAVLRVRLVLKFDELCFLRLD